MDPSSQTDDLKVGTELELPLWLVQSIGNAAPTIIEKSLPKIYTEAYREILKADPTAVDLHKLNPNFYDVGCYIMQFDPKREIGNTLMDVRRENVYLFLL